jgi:Ca2+-binding RTX toxin-like protein
MAKFVFKSAVNVNNFDYSALLDGRFGAETDTSFTVRSGSDLVRVSGHGFVYSDGAPIDGTIEAFNMRTDGDPVLLASGLSLSVSQFAADLSAHDQAALQNDLFGGKDLFVGSARHDVIYGYGGNDNIRGKGGADFIDGGAGADHLRGGDGADTFRFDSIEDSRLAAPDTIFDLDQTDTIDLHRIDADTTVQGDQDFTLVASFSGHAGEMTLAYNPELDRTTLSMDVNGDALADGVIYMIGDQTGFDSFVS